MAIAQETFAPGEHLKDELDARGWTQTEFAEIIGRPERVVSEIIGGKRAISPDTANELAAALGTSAELWLNLESAYQLAKARPANDRIRRGAIMRERFPVHAMRRRGWLPDTRDPDAIEDAVKRFFGIDDIEVEPRFAHAARRNYDRRFSKLQLAWLFRVRQLAQAVPAGEYRDEVLRAALAEMERLTVDPEEIRHVPRILSECGVRLVIVEPLPRSSLDGACFWIGKKNAIPVIGMTLRFDRNDNFWFVLRHEIEHILNGHGVDEPILDEDMANADANVSDEERIANAAALEFCVPQQELQRFIDRVDPYYSQDKVTGFARRINRHPGLVIGQLQKRLGRHDLLNKLKARCRGHILNHALVDGYGAVPGI